MWTILSILALGSLILFWRGRNAVWGGLAFGVVGGVVAATVYFLRGMGFLWPTIGKWIVISTLVGLMTELLGKLAKKGRT